MVGLISASASISLRGIYFLPSDDDLKAIYGNSGWMYGGEIAFNVFKGLDVWLDGGYYGETGTLTFTEEETKLKSVSVAILLMLIVTSYLQAAFVLTKSLAFSGDSSHDVT